MSSAQARQDDHRLPPLFKQLSVAKDLMEAKAIEQAIWEIWMTSGNDAVDQLMSQGMQNLQYQNFKQAYHIFSIVIEIDPDFAEAWNKRALVRFLVGDLNGSLQDVARVLELEPRHFGAFAGLGQIYELKKAHQQALSAFEKAVRLNPHMSTVAQKIEKLRLLIKDQKI
ncbi:MAG: hypothetical protein MI743_00160 [Sneathiellales bacterium]|nr:hypothetical protein [Sneathiellales bacterium]